MSSKKNTSPIKNGKWGTYSHEGKELIPTKYDTLIKAKFVGGSSNYIVKLENSYFIVNRSGERISQDFEYLKVPKYDGDLVYIFFKDKNGKLGIINDSGNIIIKPQFDNILHFDEKHFIFEVNHKYGIYNLNSDSITIPPIYDFIGEKYKPRIQYEFVGFIKKKYFLIDPKIGASTLIQTNPF